MIFRSWTEGDEMISSGTLKVVEPSENKEILVPDVLLVPMLAFRSDC